MTRELLLVMIHRTRHAVSRGMSTHSSHFHQLSNSERYATAPPRRIADYKRKIESRGRLRRATAERLSAPNVSQVLTRHCSGKEVIQPQVPLRLPCYDFAPVTDLTLDGCPLAVGPPASGPPSFHGVTGGVYKARERIHRGVADPRLLAIPASCSRVADCNPN